MLDRTDNLASNPHQAAARPALGAPAFVAAMALAALALTAWLSVRRYLGFNAGMLDLGNMSQAVASVLRGEPLLFTYVDGNTSRLAFHVELFYFLLAPLYALWPDPRTLLIVQAALYASAAVPVYRLAARRLGEAGPAALLAATYLLYPVGLTAVLFDFHGDTLAMPLLLWAADALDRRAWRSYGLFVALALSCKFYVALPVAAMGLVIWRWGDPDQRRAGLITAVAGVVYGAVAFLGVRPLFTTAETSSAHRGLSYLSFYFGQLSQLADTALARVITAVVVFGAALLLALPGWRWLLPALPIAAATLISTGPGGSYHFRYHHYAVVVPFLILAMLDGAARRRDAAAAGRRIRSWRNDLAFCLLLTVLLTAAAVDTPLNPQFWLGNPNMGLDPSVYGVTERDALKDRFIAERVPPAAPIAASMYLAPRLVQRDTLYVTRYADDPGGERLPSLLPRVDYVLTDALFDWRAVVDGRAVAGPAYERAEIRAMLESPDFGLVAADDGLLLFARGAGADVLAQAARVIDPPPTDSAAVAGPARLLRAEIVPLGGRRFRATLAWALSGPAPAAPGLVAVSRLSGPAELRIPHLPTFALMPIHTWEAGQAVEEQFEFELPARLPPGSYRWQVGWYELARPEAYATDGRSRAGDELPAGDLTLP